MPPQPKDAADGAREIRPDGQHGEHAGQRANGVYRQQLERKHGDAVDKLQDTLALKMRDAMTKNKELGDLLRIEMGALLQIDSVEEIAAFRQILIGGVEELLQGQAALAGSLDSTSDYLRIIESDSERLQDELHKVRLMSLTDEFTGLPNRRAFMRRLEDEIGRAQRYDTPLSLAIVDLDEFKIINDTFGHVAGDQVLRCLRGTHAVDLPAPRYGSALRGRGVLRLVTEYNAGRGTARAEQSPEPRGQKPVRI